MSVAQYQRLQGGQKDLCSALMAWRERHAAALAVEGPEHWPAPFADVRDHRPDEGRPPIDWQNVLAYDPVQPEPQAGKARKPRKRVGR